VPVYFKDLNLDSLQPILMRKRVSVSGKKAVVWKLLLHALMDVRPLHTVRCPAELEDDSLRAVFNGFA
jgi:hypothetical protein